MKINDVEKITGLSKKAIRLYESKGLITITRDKNGYRNYSEQNVQSLKVIKLLRSVGASLSDIKLYVFGVITINELVDKRKAEILKESGENSEKFHTCESILKNESISEIDDLKNIEFSESEEAREKDLGTLCVGIDIGTTTVSAVVYDIDSKEQVEAYTLPHNSYVRSDYCSEQSVNIIMEKAQKLLFHILDSYADILSIGITGQMHGILYIDGCGNCVSNLINWQDKRGDLPLENGKSACQLIEEQTGEKIHTGYGLATHYCNTQRNETFEGAVCICSIMDYFAMKICGCKRPVLHTSVAASFGLFDVKAQAFMQDKIELLGIDKSFLPSVTGKSITIGNCRDIPVSIPIGDNQASFLGSVDENNGDVLVNIGTGSQVSAVSDYRDVTGDIEIRPFIEGRYLICGSALCGGAAYAMLEEFFKSYLEGAGIKAGSQYNVINELAKKAYERTEAGLLVNTSFFGKRSDPQCRGSINMIDRQSFTPSALALGVLKGMCNELYELYESFSEKKKRIVASGGAVRKNELLKRLIEERFGLPVAVSTVKEEAAVGAAIFSSFAINKQYQKR